MAYNMVHIKQGSDEIKLSVLKYPTLEKMQKMVGGYIERVTCEYEGRRCDMLVNEEGLMNGLPYNAQASEYAQTHLFGDVVILSDFDLK